MLRVRWRAADRTQYQHRCRDSHTDIIPAGMQQHNLWGTRLMMLVLWEPGKLSLDCMWLKRFWSA